MESQHEGIWVRVQHYQQQLLELFGTPQMVFTNLIMTTDVNRIVNQQSMGSMIVGGYKYIDATNPRGGYQKPFVVNA